MKKSIATQSLVNFYPDWSRVRSDDQSNGYQFLNVFANKLEDLDTYLFKMERNNSLVTANINEVDWLYKVYLGTDFDFEYDTSDSLSPKPITPSVRGEVINNTYSGYQTVAIAENNDLPSLWYDAVPTRVDLQETMPFSGEELLTWFATDFPFSGELNHHLGGGRVWVETVSGTQYVTIGDDNKVNRGEIILRGKTRKGTIESETLVFPWDQKQPTRKEWSKITDIEAYNLEDPVVVSIRSGDFAQEDYMSFYNARYSDIDTKVDEFWSINELIENVWDSAITERINPKNYILADIAYGNGLFVAVGYNDGTDAYIVTSPDGINWTERSNPKDFQLRGVTYANGLFVAVGQSDGTDAYLLTSPDGINWTERTNPKNKFLYKSTYGNNLFVIVGQNDGSDAYIVTSSDGITWTERSNPKAKALTGIVFGNNLFVAVGAADGVDAYIVTSPDGITWTERSNPKNVYLYDIIYGNGLFIAVGNTDGADAYIITSPDGINWTERSNPKNFRLRGVTYGNGLFAAVGDADGTDAYFITSPDGINWTERSNPKNFELCRIAYSNGRFIAVGAADGTDAYLVSTSSPGTYLSRIGYIADDWQTILLGFAEKETKESWELLNIDQDNIFLIDIAIQPFTNRIWGIEDGKKLYCYSLDEEMVSNIDFLALRTVGSEVQLEVESKKILLNETIQVDPLHIRPLQEIVKYRIWYQTPAGVKYGLLNGTQVAYASDFWVYSPELSRQIEPTISLTATERGEYGFVLEVVYADETTQNDRVIVTVQSKEPLTEIDLSSYLTGATVLGIDFDADQKMWIKTDLGYYQFSLHADLMLVDFDNKILYLREAYHSVEVE